MSEEKISYSAGVLTLSDKGSRGDRQDTSGPGVKAMLEEAGFTVRCYEILPDRQAAISDRLRDWADTEGLDLIVTTGGTGVSPSDVTPEATRAVIDREVPGIAELMRQESLRITKRAALQRGVAGIRNQCLIINLPGSAKAARENLQAVLDLLPHALDKIKGGTKDCGAA